MLPTAEETEVVIRSGLTQGQGGGLPAIDASTLDALGQHLVRCRCPHWKAAQVVTTRAFAGFASFTAGPVTDFRSALS